MVHFSNDRSPPARPDADLPELPEPGRGPARRAARPAYLHREFPEPGLATLREWARDNSEMRTYGRVGPVHAACGAKARPGAGADGANGTLASGGIACGLPP